MTPAPADGELLALFDRQVRRSLRADSDEETIERIGSVIRRESPGGWSGVVWSDLDAAGADAAIAGEVDHFRMRGGPWEWKHYSYDEPSDLPRRLLAAGLAPEDPEALMVGVIDELDLGRERPAGAELVEIRDADGVAALNRLQEEVFGADGIDHNRGLLEQITRQPRTTAAVLALVEGRPACGGRIEFYPGTEFAGLWGGATLPEFRKRGLFRAVVAARAELARARGCRYLQVDASSQSEPILRRVGFERIATTTPYRGAPGS